MSETIVVRDRRTRYQFSVHNDIIDQWFPIIGPVGFALYSLYTRMASSADESSYPGYDYIMSVLDIKNRHTVADYNNLLAWCSLVHITPGGPPNVSNTYYVLDVPEVTQEKQLAIRAAAQAEFEQRSDKRFLSLVLKRLDAWKPFSERTGRPATPRPVVMHPAQLPLPGADTALPSTENALANAANSQPSAANSQPSAANSQPSAATAQDQSSITILNNNPHEQSSSTESTKLTEDEMIAVSDLTDLIGLTEAQAHDLLKNHSLLKVRHLIALTVDYAQDNRAGYLLKCAQSGVLIPYSEEAIDKAIRKQRVTFDAVRTQAEPPPARQESDTDRMWRKVLEELSQQIRPDTFAFCLGNSKLLLNDGTATIAVRNEQACQVGARLKDTVRRALADIGEREIKALEFVCEGESQ